MSEFHPDQWEREAREIIERWLTKSSTTNWNSVDPDEIEELIGKFSAALRERGEKLEVLRRDAMFLDMARVEALEERDQLRKELEGRDAQVEALQHKFDVATTGPIMFPEEANRLRAQVQRLRAAFEELLALDVVAAHIAEGMRAVLAATEEP